MDPQTNYKSFLDGKVVGFIGFGFMAQSLAKGFLSKKSMDFSL